MAIQWIVQIYIYSRENQSSQIDYKIIEVCFKT